MSETQPTDAWLQNVRETFKSSDPVFVELLEEHNELVKWLTVFKYALELSPEAGSDNAKQVISRLDQTLHYMTKSLATIGALHGLAMMVNAVMSEHEE